MFHFSDVATIVETVSLDVGDFSETFLTCGTCLNVYNETSHAAKLLPCSHSVCLQCVRVIVEASSAVSDAAVRRSPRCPICHAGFTVPAAGGAAALPASFVVNQLLDLMSAARNSRRDVVPKCAEHTACELMFCETCDRVFCVECEQRPTDDTHCRNASSVSLTSSTAAHNVVPFAIAIRRVSEILHYKATQCARNFDIAAAAVEEEMRRLDADTERCIDTISQAFSELTAAIAQRQCAVEASIHDLCRDKVSVLDEQLALIGAERRRTDAECQNLPPDVRAITSRISRMNELLDVSLFLSEPRENAYIAVSDVGSQSLHNAVSDFGAVRTSDTFPALCTVEFSEPHITVNLLTKASILTYDATGCRQTAGGDPVSVQLLDSLAKPVPVGVSDVGDGTYEVTFTPLTAGTHSLSVRIFDRVVGSSAPISFTASMYHSCVTLYTGLHQPVAVSVDAGRLYVLDTGNSRVAVYDTCPLESRVTSPTRCIVNESLSQRAATGMSLTRTHTLCHEDDDDGGGGCGCGGGDGGGGVGGCGGGGGGVGGCGGGGGGGGGGSAVCSLFVINWRTSRVSSFTSCSSVIRRSFGCEEFVEPTSLSVADDGTVFVADNGAHVIFVFDSRGRLISKMKLMGSGSGVKSQLVTCVYAVSTHRQLLVCDDRVRAYSFTGEFLYELPAADSKGRGQYGGVVVDATGCYLASRSERGRSMIQVFSSDRRWLFTIECRPECRLRRPTGLAVDDVGHVFVADLGNNCVRKFRYV